ncbi:MAG: alpha-amylase family protein [Actinomycetota bacterium]|nr:alpha-amylase family protein [Actinomycetota bacterium]
MSRQPLVRARMRRHWPAVERGLATLYPAHGARLADQLAERVTRFVSERPDALFQRDLEREAEPDWFQQPDMVGYVAYADRFAGTLAGIHDHLDYLVDLGVTYLHLMPLLKAREGENDGGYAVASYDEVDPRLGTTADLQALAEALHERRMNLCVDLVLNHTAAEHPWAVKARAGDPTYRDYFLFYPDRTMPDRYERTMLEVFPTFAPGNFTWLPDMQQWVWTTFHEFQWDLDWSNPDVFAEMISVMLHLADLGVDALRLDAVPFMWKREGTDCQNLPEVHVLLRTLRAVIATAAPATIFKAEAIVPPDQLTPYVGAGDPPQHECELAYHNQLMVLLWSSLATGEARLMTTSLQRVAAIPTHASWVTYVRCHDDIGWAITDEAAAATGWNGFDHRNFLNEFYSGAFPTSFARGELFQFNPETGDGRISGSAASLCGIELALASGDTAHLDQACKRLELMYAVICGFGGIPLLYMGDELGMLNDHSYLHHPAHADDNRWVHRPPMDWAAAARRTVAGTLQARLFDVFRGLTADRAATPALHGGVNTEVLTPADPAILAFVRHHPVRGSFAMVANFGHSTRVFDLADLGLTAPTLVRTSDAEFEGGTIVLPPLAYAWFTTPG